MTPEQRAILFRLQRVTMPVASYDKRFRRISPDVDLTEKQAAYLLKLDHRYRRQTGGAHVCTALCATYGRRRTGECFEAPLPPKPVPIVPIQPREHTERLEAMVEDDGDTWDLSDNDKAALRFALAQINGYDEILAALKAVVGSADPNEREHPAMFSAWKVARKAIQGSYPSAPVETWRDSNTAAQACETSGCEHRLCLCGHIECSHANENAQPNCADCLCAGFGPQNDESAKSVENASVSAAVGTDTPPQDSQASSVTAETTNDDLRRIRSFIEYARYELQPGVAKFGSQFPHQADADEAISRVDSVIKFLASLTHEQQEAETARQALLRWQHDETDRAAEIATLRQQLDVEREAHVIVRDHLGLALAREEALRQQLQEFDVAGRQLMRWTHDETDRAAEIATLREHLQESETELLAISNVLDAACIGYPDPAHDDEVSRVELALKEIVTLRQQLKHGT